MGVHIKFLGGNFKLLNFNDSVKLVLKKGAWLSSLHIWRAKKMFYSAETPSNPFPRSMGIISRLAGFVNTSLSYYITVFATTSSLIYMAFSQSVLRFHYVTEGEGEKNT